MAGLRTRKTRQSDRRVFVETFGCQMNKLDTELVLSGLLRKGFAPTGELDEADLVLYNTCSVREHAEHRVWSRLGVLRKKKRNNPDLIIGVMGCMAQKEAEQIRSRMPHVDLVVGTREFTDLPDLVEEIEAERSAQIATDLTRPIEVTRDVALRPAGHHAYVSVMRGCDFSCTYCVVPYTRGPETNRSLSEIVDEARRLVDDGVVEITLLGQTIDSWGKRLPGRPNLGDLFEALHDIDGLLRIRFVTSHPSLMREPILRRMGELPKVMEYLHIPAQSGSNRILKAMRRGYTVEKYRDVVAMARDLVPNVGIASDFIVGFPGETEEDFEATCRLVESIEPVQSFIFKYSPRPRTSAWDEVPGDEVPRRVKKERNQRLLSIQEEISRRNQEARVGTTVDVLVDGPSKTDETRLAGRTPQNRIVVFEGPEEMIGSIVTLRIESATPLTLFGAPVERARIAQTPEG